MIRFTWNIFYSQLYLHNVQFVDNIETAIYNDYCDLSVSIGYILQTETVGESDVNEELPAKRRKLEANKDISLSDSDDEKDEEEKAADEAMVWFILDYILSISKSFGHVIESFVVIKFFFFLNLPLSACSSVHHFPLVWFLLLFTVLILHASHYVSPKRYVLQNYFLQCLQSSHTCLHQNVLSTVDALFPKYIPILLMGLGRNSFSGNVCWPISSTIWNWRQLKGNLYFGSKMLQMFSFAFKIIWH